MPYLRSATRTKGININNAIHAWKTAGQEARLLGDENEAEKCEDRSRQLQFVRDRDHA